MRHNLVGNIVLQNLGDFNSVIFSPMNSLEVRGEGISTKGGLCKVKIFQQSNDARLCSQEKIILKIYVILDYNSMNSLGDREGITRRRGINHRDSLSDVDACECSQVKLTLSQELN